MMQAVFDLDRYLERIGYAGSTTATLETLQSIHLKHAQTIPFENLNPLLRWPVRLDAASLQRKLVHEHRGGYCFEHNLLLSHALTTLGFEVTGLSARVLWGAPDRVGPRDHMLLLVDLDDAAYVADAGFGGMTPTAPLRLRPDEEQATPHEPFRLIRKADTFVLETKLADSWRPLYAFDLQPQLLPDYEVANWYTSSHPDSHFLTTLVAARAGVDCRYALRNGELTIHHAGGRTERHRLTTVSELKNALVDRFGVAVPEVPELYAAFERLLGRSADLQVCPAMQG
jgi:N-hydroxyarylamine O-acetyltransferase